MGRRRSTPLARIFPASLIEHAVREPARGDECAHGIQVGQCGSCAAGGLPPTITTPLPGQGCYPATAVDAQSGRFATAMYAEALRASRMSRKPYEDPYYDAVHMDTIYSDVQSIAPAVAGAFTNIEVQPVAGTFAMFYWSITVTDPDGVSVVDWRVQQPRIENCPVPCQPTDRHILPAFVAKVPEGCCGQPLAAWLDAPANDTPLIIPFRNDQAAGNVNVQVQLRGYCCNRRLC